MPPSLNDHSPSRAWQKGLFACLILGICGLIMAMNYADPDLWGHVLYGQEILADGELPHTTTWSFTAEGYRWVNHENIAELAMAGAVNLFGPFGLTIGKYLMGWGLLGLIWWRGRSAGVRLEVLAFVCLIMAFSIQFHWHFRPQIFGYLLFGITCALLNWCFESTENALPQKKRLWHLFWLIPIMMIWTNTHGSFAAGLAITIAFLGLQFVDLAWNHFWRESVETLKTSGVTWFLILLPAIVLLLILSTFVNPYGADLHLWLWGALHEPRPEIGDWEQLGVFRFSREVIGFWAMTLTALMVVKHQGQRVWISGVLFALVATQAVSHIRHLPLLAILWGSFFSRDIDQLWKAFLADFKTKTTEHPTSHQAVPTAGLSRGSWLTVALLLAGLTLVAGQTASRLSQLNVPRDRYPVDALKFMADNDLEGRTVVTFNWAQYAIAFFSNEQMESRVAFDGRFRTCYPQEVIDIYFDFIFGDSYSGPRHRSPKSGPVDPTRALSYRDPELFLISRKQRASVKTMEDHRDSWTLLYEDQLAQVWGRREVFASQESPKFLAESKRSTENKAQQTAAAWPAFANRNQEEPKPLHVASQSRTNH